MICSSLKRRRSLWAFSSLWPSSCLSAITPSQSWGVGQRDAEHATAEDLRLRHSGAAHGGTVELTARIHRPRAEDRIRLPQFANLPLLGLQPLARLGRQPRTFSRVSLVFPHEAAQDLGRALQLSGNGLSRRPVRRMALGTISHQAHGALRTCGGNGFALLKAPTSPSSEPPANPGRSTSRVQISDVESGRPDG